MNSKIGAHPFVISSIGEPISVLNAGEYTAIAKSDCSISIYKCQKLLSTFPSNATQQPLKSPSTCMRMRCFANPLLISTNGTSEIVLFNNQTFQKHILTTYLLATKCTILDSSTALICDDHTAFYYIINNNSCKFCFASRDKILEIYSISKYTFVFTTSTFKIIPRDGLPISITFKIPSNSIIRHSADLSAFYICFGKKIAHICFDGKNIKPKDTIDSSVQFRDFCVLGINGEYILTHQYSEENKKHFVQKYNVDKNEWSGMIDVPPISVMCGSLHYAFAVSPQFILVLHENQEVFQPFAIKIPSMQNSLNLIPEINGSELFNVILLFYGLHLVAQALSNDNERLKAIVQVILEELWKREMFDQWASLAIQFQYEFEPHDLTDRIVELLRTVDLNSTPLVSFATILENNGHRNEALKLYLHAKDGESILLLLPSIIDQVDPYIKDIMDLCSLLIKSYINRSIVKEILNYFARNCYEINPSKVLQFIMLDFNLLELYYYQFEKPPVEVANAYFTAMVIYEPAKIDDFIKNTQLFDVNKASSTLLKLGCLKEYGKLQSIVSPSKYMEYLILNEDWIELFNFLQDHKSKWSVAFKQIVNQKEYFLEFIKRYPIIDLNITEIINKIPKDCLVSGLIDGFKYIPNLIHAHIESDLVTENICQEESFTMFNQLMKQKKYGTIIKL